MLIGWTNTAPVIWNLFDYKKHHTNEKKSRTTRLAKRWYFRGSIFAQETRDPLQGRLDDIKQLKLYGLLMLLDWIWQMEPSSKFHCMHVSLFLVILPYMSRLRGIVLVRYLFCFTMVRRVFLSKIKQQRLLQKCNYYCRCNM